MAQSPTDRAVGFSIGVRDFLFALKRDDPFGIVSYSLTDPHLGAALQMKSM